ncbi:anthranilate synthase component II [Chloroflexota bacterium]
MLLLIDNYDSFTYNLYQYLAELGEAVTVVRNNKITPPEIESMQPEKIIISPGPSNPAHAGVSVEVIRHFGGRLPILGVCLGHQCIGAAYGAEVVGAPIIMHGKSSQVFHEGGGIFRGIENPFNAIRYHSLIIRRDGLPDSLEVTAWTADGTIMGVKHCEHEVEGMQFHPESFMTEHGKVLLANFLARRRPE